MEVTDDRPRVFISYAHADKVVAAAFAAGLEAEGLAVWIDDNELLAGDSIIEQISNAVADVDFFCVLVSLASHESRWCCKELSLAISGSLGREGATVIPLRVGEVEMPSSLQDVLYVDLDPSQVSAAVQRIARDVRRHREREAQLGATAVTQEEQPAPCGVPLPGSDEREKRAPVSIVAIVKEGVGKPRNDGTRGSGLYRIPLRLSRHPTALWARLFVETWDHPPRCTTMHRPGIATVQGDTIILDGTEMDELERYHAETLKHVIAKVNGDVAAIEAREKAAERRQQQLDEAHQRDIDDVASRLRFE